jgi:uncharacterized cysteine cluster protein YcgN (CxxCxxCC family)
MEDIDFTEAKEGQREAICNRCGGAAVWRYLDADQSRVELICVDCGSFEIERGELDVVETDIAGPEDPEP